MFLIFIYLSLVLQLGKFGCSLLVHFLLEISSLKSIFLIDLFEDINLVVLSAERLLCCSSLKFFILSGYCSFNLLSLVFFDPLHLFFPLLFQENVLLARFVDVFKQVYSSLLLSLPLSFTHLVLSLSLPLNELIDQFLIGLLIMLSCLIIFLQLNNFFSAL